jgi:molybdenum ABC transporter molybdate-binding protein
VRFNFASSGTLQQQIERGAPVDVFISAADKQMNSLATKNLIMHSTRRILAHNELVLVVPRTARVPIRNFSDLGSPSVRRIAIGAPASVPAGQYAEQMLRKLGLWNRVQPKAVQGKDVREVLTQVALGNVDAGLVYRTDAATTPQVRIVKAAPKGSHQSHQLFDGGCHEYSQRHNGARLFEFSSNLNGQSHLEAARFPCAALIRELNSKRDGEFHQSELKRNS